MKRNEHDNSNFIENEATQGDIKTDSSIWYKFVDTAFGSPKNRNRVISVEELEIPDDIANCFTSMYRFRKEFQEHSKKTGSVSGTSQFPCYSDYLWFDIDNTDLEVALIDARQLLINIELIDSTLSEKVLNFFSGSKGFHFGLPAALFGMKPSADLPRIHKRLAKTIAKDVSIDTAIYEHNRLWRIPNTKNSRSGHYKIPLTFDQLATLTIEEIKELAKQPLCKPYLCLVEQGEFTPQENLIRLYQQAILELSSPDTVISSNGDPESTPWLPKSLASLSPGNRNETFTRITGKLHHNGFSPEEIKALLKPHAKKCQFPVSEFDRQIDGICRRYPVSDPVPDFPPYIGGNLETGSQELQIKPLNEFLNEKQPELTWAVENLFPIESINFIAGPAGHGKSWMLHDLAIATATGDKWLGHFATSQGSVLYIDEESSGTLLRNRFHALIKARSEELDLSNVYLCVGQGINFSDAKSFKRLLHVIDTYRPAVIIIDCLIRVHSAEENSASEMSRVFKRVKSIVSQIGCTIVIADHHRKPGKNSTSQDYSLRGSSDKMAIADSVLSIRSQDNRITIEHTKSRHSQAINPFIVEIKDLDEDSTTVRYVGEAERNDRSAKLGKAQQFIEQELDSEQWTARRVLTESAKEEGISLKVLDNALKQLVADGKIERDDRPPENGKGGKSAFYRRKEN